MTDKPTGGIVKGTPIKLGEAVLFDPNAATAPFDLSDGILGFNPDSPLQVDVDGYVRIDPELDHMIREIYAALCRREIITDQN